MYLYKDVRGLLDVDNLSKPFIDAFTNIIYEDDNQIKHRECSCISLRDSYNIEINCTLMNEKALEKLQELLDNGANQILYFELYMLRPNRDSIEFDGLGELIMEYLMDNFPSDLDELSSHAKLIEVYVETITDMDYEIDTSDI